jgi:DNA-binding NtrC family response regulator
VHLTTAVSNGPHVLRVLVVDDEALIRWSFTETLSDAGCEVVAAIDAASAVRAVASASVPFDVVLLDFRLPDSHDLTLLSRLRQLAGRMRVILMTAHSTPEMLQEALDRGAYCTINKPFEMNALAALVAGAHASHS